MRLRIRHGMATVVVAALILAMLMGLKRRSERLLWIARNHGRMSVDLEDRAFPPSTSPMSPTDFEIAAIMRHVHWYDAAFQRYRIASKHPWQLADPDSDTIVSDCGCHRGMSRAEAMAP